MGTEGLLQAVSRGEIMATVADEKIFLKHARKLIPNLKQGRKYCKK